MTAEEYARQSSALRLEPVSVDVAGFTLMARRHGWEQHTIDLAVKAPPLRGPVQMGGIPGDDYDGA